MFSVTQITFVVCTVPFPELITYVAVVYIVARNDIAVRPKTVYPSDACLLFILRAPQFLFFSLSVSNISPFTISTHLLRSPYLYNNLLITFANKQTYTKVKGAGCWIYNIMRKEGRTERRPSRELTDTTITINTRPLLLILFLHLFLARTLSLFLPPWITVSFLSFSVPLHFSFVSFQPYIPLLFMFFLMMVSLVFSNDGGGGVGSGGVEDIAEIYFIPNPLSLRSRRLYIFSFFNWHYLFTSFFLRR